MSPTLQRLDGTAISKLPETVRNAGIAGAGGAGFPTYAKWERVDEVDALLVNHQESEPNFYIDKWLGREYAEEFASLFDRLLESALDLVVIGAKETDRTTWMDEIEAATDGAVYTPDELPLDPEAESGVVFAYTNDRYEYGMESVLLNVTAGTVIGRDLPMDHGWIVQNTETLYNLYRALDDGTPVTRKYVHVDGNTPRHRSLEVPVGTPATALLEATGYPVDEPDEEQVLVDGGPGWCFEIEGPPEQFGVRKRTNCVLALDEALVRKHTLGTDRISILDHREWNRSQETEPTETLQPEYVRVPLISNPAFEGIVAPSRPIVTLGERVAKGETIAVPSDESISNTQHASIAGVIADVSDTHVEIAGELRPTDEDRTTMFDPVE